VGHEGCSYLHPYEIEELFDPREHRASGSGWSNGWSFLRKTWEASDVVLGEELRTATCLVDTPEISTARIVFTRMGVPARGRSVLGLGVIVALVGASCASSGQLGAKALLEQSKTLRSEAAEGALLSEDAVSGKATSNYIHEHAVELSEAASQIEATLKAATTEPALEPALGQLAILAGQISADLGRLSEASTDEQRTLTSELQAAADATQRIGEGLT
jgi:hypothetical protein